MVHDPQGQVQRDVAPVESLLLLRVVDQGAVGEDVIADEGEGFQLLRNAAQDPSRGGDDVHAALGCQAQRVQVFLRQALGVIQQRPVQIKGNQFAIHCVFPVPKRINLLWPVSGILARLFSRDRRREQKTFRIY